MEIDAVDRLANDILSLLRASEARVGALSQVNAVEKSLDLAVSHCERADAATAPTSCGTLRGPSGHGGSSDGSEGMHHVPENQTAARPLQATRQPADRARGRAAGRVRARRTGLTHRRGVGAGRTLQEIDGLADSSTVCFLVRCPESFWASAISASSTSILGRMAAIRCVFPANIIHTAACGQPQSGHGVPGSLS